MTPDELPDKFREYQRSFRSNKLRDEFIDKLSSIYSSLVGDPNTQKDIKILWRWVKELIQSKKDSLINESRSYVKLN